MASTRLVLSVLLLAFSAAGCGGGSRPEEPGDDGAVPTADAARPSGGCLAGCPAGQVCVEGRCSAPPSRCPCPRGWYCDLATSSCVAGCLGDDDCEAGSFCEVAARSCRDGCRGEADCPDEADVCIDHVCTDGCGGCDDGDPCTDDRCVRGTCEHGPGPDGATCADDGSVCTRDVCGAGRCTHPAGADGGSCPDDGNPCTGEVCRAGRCAHDALADNTRCESSTERLRYCRSGVCAAPTMACDYTVWVWPGPVTLFTDGDYAGSTDACQCVGGTTLNYERDGFWHPLTCAQCLDRRPTEVICW